MSGSSAAGGNLTSEKIDTPEYSTHNLSHTIRTTAVGGELYPLEAIRMVTGDEMDIDGNLTTMFLPTNKPFLDEWEQTLHGYFVPNRLTDPNWKQFFTGGKDGTYSYTRPCFDLYSIASLRNMMANFTDSDAVNYDFSRAIAAGQLFDMFRLIPEEGWDQWTTFNCTSDRKPTYVSYDPFIAYQRIYNDFYRIPELECDLFLDIPLTPDDVVKDMINSAWETINPSYSSSSGPSYNAVNAFAKFYEMFQSKDGYFWRFYEFLARMCAHHTQPKQIAILIDKMRWVSNTATANNVDIVLLPTNNSTITDSSIGIGGDGTAIHHDGFVYGTLGSTTWSLASTLYPSSNSVWSANGQPDYLDTNLLSCMRQVFAVLLGAWMVSAFKPHSMCYERDMYNIALPYTMRGVGAVLMNNIATTANVSSSTTISSGSTINPFRTFGDQYTDTLYSVLTTSGDAPLYSVLTKQDLQNLNADTRYLEKCAKYGYRYNEYLRGIFGISSDVDNDDKVQYIGGLKSGINATRVTNMSGTPDSDNNVQIGQWSGEAGTNANGKVGHVFAPENGMYIPIYCCKPRLTYVNIPDVENYKVVDRTQFFTPDYAYIQEQPLLYQHLTTYGTAQSTLSNVLNGLVSISTYGDPLGNVPRYNEYRQIPSTTHGFLADNNYADFQAFTCSRHMVNYSDDPTNVVEMNHVRPYDADIARIFQVAPTDVHPFIIEFGEGISAKRLVPAFTPVS